MIKKNPNTFIELLNEYEVEVPIVQRDYAQGRQDKHTKMVRDNLLIDMKSSILKEKPPLDLNFVYGKTENGKFIPIDGQQRLTTLFFLHVYAFREDDNKSDVLYKFTYETRKSSRDFLEKMVENRYNIFSSKLSPSEEIEDSEWFVSSWKFDPTIQSALIMMNGIKKVFADIEDLSEILYDQKFKPIIFQFLEMENLGMEDSLYIKLNARGKPLTSFENFKARLIGRLQKLDLPFRHKFEQDFDGNWTDLFWADHKENFDKVDRETFETIFYTLNFLCEDKTKSSKAFQLIFKALTGKQTYSERVLFYVVSIYMYTSKGMENESLNQWIRIFENLTLNSQIDTYQLYSRSIEGVSNLVREMESLLQYLSKIGEVKGFSQEQIKEEQIKAKIILLDKEFARMIYEAEQHPYFSGQIRSALYYAEVSEGKYDKKIFENYWDKIAILFENTKPKHGNLLRRSLLTLGDYTLGVSEYKTLCIDDPNEASSTPSMKRLFSNHGKIIKHLLDTININSDIESQLRTIIKNSKIPQNNWRYCFIEFPKLFNRMSISHLRLREVNTEMLIIPNKSSNGYNEEVFIATLKIVLQKQKIESYIESELGMWADRWLKTKGLYVRYKSGLFIIMDQTDTQIIFESKTEDPITETLNYIVSV